MYVSGTVGLLWRLYLFIYFFLEFSPLKYVPRVVNISILKEKRETNKKLMHVVDITEVLFFIYDIEKNCLNSEYT